ncbi:kinase-like domain-containing protein [Rhizophagus irregularis DAOM 181602=DAOM 197198]|nr:kinase-like domain-containing protein [Rhizophagus irregularis DAOM 181602=DAOM 197198]
MEILNKTSKEEANLWKVVNWNIYQNHVTVSSIDSATKSEEIDVRVIYMDEIETRKKVYAEWSGGYIGYWDIENQKWYRFTNKKVALKSLDNSSDISTDFLNEIKSYLQIYIRNIVFCYGITRDPNTKDYIMLIRISISKYNFRMLRLFNLANQISMRLIKKKKFES